MVKLMLLAEFPGCETEEEAMALLDAFREAVVPSQNWNITLSRMLWEDVAQFVLATSPLATQGAVKAVESAG